MKLSVIMACHNRKILTVRAIERAQAAADFAGLEVDFVVFDDGSTDGTAEALSSMPSAIRTLHGDGTAYWARSMAEAELEVLEDKQDSADQYLVWLNDDVALDREAFVTLARTIQEHPDSIVVGATRDPSTGNLTYSGMRRSGIHPLRYTMVPPRSAATDIETFNGNLVVVRSDIALALGGIDGSFSHAFADIDYGLRCKRAGVPILLAPGTLGTCPRNPESPSMPIRQEWARFIGPKGGGNFRSLKRILHKSNRRSWFLIIVATYCVWWTRSAVCKTQEAAKRR